MLSALLVDRDADTRLLYAEYLRQSAYEVEESEDGREALAKAIARVPSVVITETRLPGMSGYDLCRVLRSDLSTVSVPIVVVTGDSGANDLKRAEDAGADAVLVKPCLPDRLGAEMQRVLARSPDVRRRPQEVYEKIGTHVAKPNELIGRTPANGQHIRLSRVHDRRTTALPPAAPPALVCPVCDKPLTYVVSRIGGVSERFAEQWDYFECVVCSCAYEYRQRTKKIRLYTFALPGRPAISVE